jgi:hypothetical protein
MNKFRFFTAHTHTRGISIEYYGIFLEKCHLLPTFRLPHPHKKGHREQIRNFFNKNEESLWKMPTYEPHFSSLSLSTCQYYRNNLNFLVKRTFELFQSIRSLVLLLYISQRTSPSLSLIMLRSLPSLSTANEESEEED